MKKAITVLFGLTLLFLFEGISLAEVQEVSQNHRVQDLTDKAALARSNDNLEEAIRYYQDALQLEPNNGLLFRNLGVLLFEAGEIPRSAHTLRRANELNPNDVYTLIYLSRAHLNLKDYESAKTYLKIAEKKASQDPNILTALADLYRKMKFKTEAKDAYEKAIELDPENAHSYSGLGQLYYESKKYQRAIGKFKKAAELSPEDGDIWYNLGLSYYGLNDLNQAAENLYRSLQYAPNNAESFNALGSVFETARRWKLAEKSFRKAIEIDPDYSTARQNLKKLSWEKRRAESRISVHTYPGREPFFAERGYDGRTGYDPTTGYADRSKEDSLDIIAEMFAKVFGND